MKRIISILAIALTVTLTVDANSSKLPIVPAPQEVKTGKGNFTITGKTRVQLPTDTEEMRNAIAPLADRLMIAGGIYLEATTKPLKVHIICKLNPKIENKEGYKLSVKSSSIQIEAKGAEGIFYAFQTLRQLLPAEIESPTKVEGVQWQIPCCEIKDAPSFGYRGLMLDEARHFFGKEYMKRFIDLMAFHKFNTLHWHLTDDQGWRIEIKKHPKLTEIGSRREMTLINHLRSKVHEWDTKPYGGFYTQEEIKEIVAYAQKRFITIIPEIEMPGHAQAALACYPDLSCSGGPFVVSPIWGVHNDIYCTKEANFKLLEDIIDEVAPLFPAPFIHIGGDEAPKVRWKRCAHCQAKIKELKLRNEHELQGWFITRMENYVSKKGKRIIGWNEIMEGTIPTSSIIMSWQKEKPGIEAAQQGFDVIMTPYNYLYLDYYQADPKTEPLTIGGNLPMEKVYSFNPIPKELTAEQGKRILGVQANLWTEYIRDTQKLEYMLYPRAAAVAETGWTSQANKNYGDFYNRLKGVLKHYDLMKVNYSKSNLTW